jgi:CelD/BcsL family acetyltransferase involved in cellulose biosynthesis
MSNVTLRPSDRLADAVSAANLRAEPGVELQPELPLADSPPLSVADTPAAAVDPRSGVTLQVCGVLDEVAHDWTAFEQRADRMVFQSFAWVAAWQRHVGTRRGTVPAIVLGRESDGQLLFILPLAIEMSGPVRRLTWLGSGLCDYNAPLLAGHFSDRMSAERFVLVWRDIIALLRADQRFRFDLIDLQKMPEAVGAQRNPFLDLKVGVHPSGAYVASLDGDWESFYAARRSASTRKRERRQLKHLAEHGEVRLVDVDDGEDVAQTLATLIAQKSRAFARMGVEDLFGRPGYREFYLAVAGDPALRETVHVSRLDVGTTPAAANIGLQFRHCYYLILSSYDDGELARFGPGRAHLHELLRRAIEHGLRRFDFTVGDEPYKRDWADVELRLYDHLAAATLRGYCAATLVAAFRRTKRFIKQSPTLWPIFSKARALMGAFNKR